MHKDKQDKVTEKEQSLWILAQKRSQGLKYGILSILPQTPHFFPLVMSIVFS